MLFYSVVPLFQKPTLFVNYDNLWNEKQAFGRFRMLPPRRVLFCLLVRRRESAFSGFQPEVPGIFAQLDEVRVQSLKVPLISGLPARKAHIIIQTLVLRPGQWTYPGSLSICSGIFSQLPAGVVSHPLRGPSASGFKFRLYTHRSA